MKTINFYNCDEVNILLRGAIESVVVMKLLLDNDEALFAAFYEQKDKDQRDLKQKFNGKSKHFSLSDSIEVKKYNRYHWASAIIDKKVISINDLIEATSYDEDFKDILISEVMHNNNLSHPMLKNDSVILDGLTGSGNMREILYFLDISNKSMLEVLSHFVAFDKRFFSGENAKTILNCEYVKAFESYDNGFFGEKQKGYSEETIKLLGIINKNYDTSKTHAATLEAAILSPSVLMMQKTSNDDAKPRLYRTLSKYLESLYINVYELSLALELKKSYILFTKLRYTLELFSTIDILSQMNETQIEVYQAHTDILNYLSWIKMPKSIKSQFNEDFNKIMVKIKGKEKTVFHIYEDNLRFIEKYYLEQYGLKLRKNQLKHVNAWAINLIENNNRAPSNQSIIIGFIEKYLGKDREQKLDYVTYFKGLYALSCSYSHATALSVNEVLSGNDEFYMNEAYYYFIKVYEVFMKNMESRFEEFRVMQSIAEKSIKLKYENTYEFSVAQILQKLKNQVII